MLYYLTLQKKTTFLLKLRSIWFILSRPLTKTWYNVLRDNDWTSERPSVALGFNSLGLQLFYHGVFCEVTNFGWTLVNHKDWQSFFQTSIVAEDLSRAHFLWKDVRRSCISPGMLIMHFGGDFQQEIEARPLLFRLCLCCHWSQLTWFIWFWLFLVSIFSLETIGHFFLLLINFLFSFLTKINNRKS